MLNTTNKECRFYENKLPEINDLVLIQIKDVNENFIVVELLEYDKQEGMILLSDYTRSTRQTHNSLKLNKLKQQNVCQVIRIDKDKNFIDLSKKNIDNARKIEAEQQFEKGKKIQNFLYQFCDWFNMDMEEIYKMIIWPLSRNHSEHPFDLFHKAVFNFDEVFENIEFPKDFREKLEIEIKKRLTPQIVKVRALLEITCLNKEAINDLKEALILCRTESTTEIPVTINVFSPPSYILQASTMNKEKGTQAIFRCIKKVEEFMKNKGFFKYKDYGDQKDILEMMEIKTIDEIGEEDNNETMGDEDICMD